MRTVTKSNPERDFISFMSVCFVALRPKSTAMVIAGRSVHLTTLFSWASLNKQLTSTLCTYFRLWLTTTLLEWFRGREENDRRNHFMINLHKSMEPGRDLTRDPWICSQTRICCQTLYWLRYAARFSFMSRRRKYADVLPILAQNKSIYTWHVHNSPNSPLRRKKSIRSCSMKE